MLGQIICDDTWSSVIVYRLTASDIYQYSIVYILIRSVIPVSFMWDLLSDCVCVRFVLLLLLINYIIIIIAYVYASNATRNEMGAMDKHDALK